MARATRATRATQVFPVCKVFQEQPVNRENKVPPVLQVPKVCEVNTDPGEAPECLERMDSQDLLDLPAQEGPLETMADLVLLVPLDPLETLDRLEMPLPGDPTGSADLRDQTH